MSTRRLILAALLCGLAILVAGGVQLLRLAGDEPIELPVLGESRTIAGLTVTPVELLEVGGLTVVTVELRGDVGVGETGSWTLVRISTFAPVGLPDGLDAPDCAQLDPGSATARCAVAFAAPGDAARFLAFKRGSVEARWALG